MQVFSCPFEAQYIRINPLEWHDGIGLRFDLLGCDIDCKNIQFIKIHACTEVDVLIVIQIIDEKNLNREYVMNEY